MAGFAFLRLVAVAAVAYVCGLVLASAGAPAAAEWPTETNNYQGLCILTAASGNHFRELLKFIVQMQTVYPCRGLYIYDLGLESDQVQFLNTLNIVRLMHLPMPNNQSYVNSFNAKVFKARAIIHFTDAYREHHQCPVFFYGDTSIRHTRPFDRRVLDEVRRLGLVASAPSKFKQVEFTVPAMYEFFHVDREADFFRSERTSDWLYQVQSGLMIVDASNQTIRRDFMERWAQCCENPDCVSHGEATNLDIRFKRRYNINGTNIFRTNRDDQSAFTFLMDEYFGRGEACQRSVFVDNYLQVSHHGVDPAQVEHTHRQQNMCDGVPGLPPPW